MKTTMSPIDAAKQIIRHAGGTPCNVTSFEENGVGYAYSEERVGSGMYRSAEFFSQVGPRGACLNNHWIEADLSPKVVRALVVLRGGAKLTTEHRDGYLEASAAGLVMGGARDDARLTAFGRVAIEAHLAELHAKR